jgi:hypothetical protein
VSRARIRCYHHQWWVCTRSPNKTISKNKKKTYPELEPLLPPFGGDQIQMHQDGLGSVGVGRHVKKL